MADEQRRAVFLDRDGTIVDDPPPGYLKDPAAVRLLPGAAAAIRRLNEAGWLAVVVSNQSGIARGLYTEADYRAVERRVTELLAEGRARLDSSFFCPHHPEFTGPCLCRKPGTRLFEEAAAHLGIDPTRSWFVGDRPSDVAPARRLGGRGLLVLTGEGARHRAQAEALGAEVATDLAGAVDTIMKDRRTS
ncbi:MAG: D-glycero-alpha-D-manno-heptose-1,7-bisphosphate 7-phosphatase [Gemmatimonadota bacterium]